MYKAFANTPSTIAAVGLATQTSQILAWCARCCARRAGWFTFLAVAAILWCAGAAAQRKPPTWACGSADVVRRRVQALVGPNTPIKWPSSIRIEHFAPDHYRLRLVLDGAKRTLTNPSCEALLDGAVVMVAATVRPRTQANAGAPPTENAPPAAGAPPTENAPPAAGAPPRSDLPTPPRPIPNPSAEGAKGPQTDPWPPRTMESPPQDAPRGRAGNEARNSATPPQGEATAPTSLGIGGSTGSTLPAAVADRLNAHRQRTAPERGAEARRGSPAATTDAPPAPAAPADNPNTADAQGWPAPWTLGVRLGAGFNALPQTTGIVGLRGAAHRDAWALAADLEYWIARQTTRRGSANAVVGAWGAGLLFGYLPVPALGLWLGPHLHRVNGEGRGNTITPQSDHAAWLSVTAEAQATLRLGAGLLLELAVGGRYGLTRPSFQVVGFGEVFRVRRWSATGTIGLQLEIP